MAHFSVTVHCHNLVVVLASRLQSPVDGAFRTGRRGIKQVRLRGPVTLVDTSETDAYFASRPLQSKIGAWASQQSRPLDSRFALETAAAKYAAKFGLAGVPRPPHWLGYRIAPIYLEFWSEGAFRLHDRIVFRRQTGEDAWRKERLYP